jgi:hypothetical protein
MQGCRGRTCFAYREPTHLSSLGPAQRQPLLPQLQLIYQLSVGHDQQLWLLCHDPSNDLSRKAKPLLQQLLACCQGSMAELRQRRTHPEHPLY